MEIMMKKGNKVISLILAGLLSVTGCGNSQKDDREYGPYDEFITVDVFDNQANYQGIQSGWFGKLIKDKFNMELNIIAPNVAGGGDTLFETRFAAGNLGDLVLFSAKDKMIQDMVTAGLLLDMEPYLKDKSIMKYEEAIRNVNEGIMPKGIYVLPSGLSDKLPTEPSETIEPSYGPYIRWDLYRELGYPELNTIEDLLPVLKKMQQLEPETAQGNRTYGFSFFKDWDNNLMVAAKQPCCFYGYDESGFLLVKADGSDCQSIADENSLYVRMLHLFFKANQMGLVDPESQTQNYAMYADKYKNGQIFFSPWAWAAQPQYNTVSNKEQGKGYMMADIADMLIYSYGRTQLGNMESVIAIGAEAKDPERMADFIEWLYSPEGVMCNEAGGLSGAAGPEGICWEYGENGPILTEYGKKALFESDVAVPEEFGGGIWEEGLSELNFKPLDLSGSDDKGYPYQFQLWDSVQQMQETALDREWREYMGAETTMEYLMEHDKIIVSPVGSFVTTPDSVEQAAIRKQCRNVIQQYSWDMIFAEDEQAFYQLLHEMQTKLAGLGFQEILAFDMENADSIQRQKQLLIEIDK